MIINPYLAKVVDLAVREAIKKIVPILTEIITDKLLMRNDVEN